MKKQMTLIIFLFFGILLVNAQTWTQVGNNINGEAAEDQSGYSVSISADGQIVAIGANENDGNGNSSGHVRIFQNTAGTWIQIGADIDGEAAEDDCGVSVSLSADGSVVAIGAIYNDGNGSSAGHVRVFKNNNGNWTQIGSDLDGKVFDENFGFSVSLNSDGSVVAVGTPLPPFGGHEGVVRIFKNTSGTWTQLGDDILALSDNDEALGFSVSLNSDGTIVAIGANDANAGKGYVKILQFTNGNWIQIGANIDGENVGDFFGWSVSLNSDGTIVAIGAPLNNDNAIRAGQVRIFKNTVGTWTQIGGNINGESREHRSGKSVSLSANGSIVAIGSPYDNGQGSNRHSQVRVFKNSNGHWTQIGEDIDGENNAFDHFGWSVSLNSDGTTVAIGAFSNDGNGEHSGSTRIFTTGGSLGISEVSRISIIIYPNPTTGILKINSKIPITHLEIYNQLGQLIFVNHGENNIDISDLNSGIYMVKIQDQNGRFGSKMLVKI